MASQRAVAPQVRVDTFDLVGSDGNVHGFVQHAGIAAQAGIFPRDAVDAIDMAPPLRMPGQMPVDVTGSASLSDDDVRIIQDFIDRHALEHEIVRHLRPTEIIRRAAEMYTILPHAAPLKESNGKSPRTRFSCGGFALEAYRRAGVRLVDPETLPRVTLDDLKVAYPAFRKRLENPDFRSSMGLGGEGPWPILLCGYLFHALNRDTSLLRTAYLAVQKEHCMFG